MCSRKISGTENTALPAKTEDLKTKEPGSYYLTVQDWLRHTNVLTKPLSVTAKFD